MLAIGLLAVMMARVSLASVPESVRWFGVGLAELMLAIAIIDWRHFIIPNRLNATAFLLGLVHAWWQDPQDPLVALATALARGAVLAAAFWALRFCYERIRGRDGRTRSGVGAGILWPSTSNPKGTLVGVEPHTVRNVFGNCRLADVDV